MLKTVTAGTKQNTIELNILFSNILQYISLSVQQKEETQPGVGCVINDNYFFLTILLCNQK